MKPVPQHVKSLLNLVKGHKRIFIIGNGGSAANATHLANDLILCGLPAHSLAADVATLTAIGNDFGYEHIFSKQLEVLGSNGDLLIVLSGSGNSPNIIKAITTAKKKGLYTLAIVGGWDESAAQHLAHEAFCVGDNMQLAEEYQLALGHAIYRSLKGLK